MCTLILNVFVFQSRILRMYLHTMGLGVAYWLRRCATSRKGLGGVTWDFFRSSFRKTHVPWGRLSLWKWVPEISPGLKAAGVFGWQSTALVVPKVKKIRGLNLPRTPWTTSACRGIPLLLHYLHTINPLHVSILIHSLQTKILFYTLSRCIQAVIKSDHKTTRHKKINLL
jgi:hypothetical protein